MTYEEFLESKFYIPEAEFNDLYIWSDKSLLLGEVSDKYNIYSKIRFYEYIFDSFLSKLIKLYNLLYSISNINYHFLFFKLDHQFNIFPDDAKIKILEKYYGLFAIYKKYHVDKVKEKSPINYYQQEILMIEPLFTRKNINKLIQEFSDFDFNNSSIIYNWGLKNSYYVRTIYRLMTRFVDSYDTLEISCARRYLNKRGYPKDYESFLLSQGLSEKYVDEYLKNNPKFEAHVLEIYNKFIYWFELDRSFTI